MRIGLEARWLQMQTTGFGKYAFNLLRALKELPSEHDFVVYLNDERLNPELFPSERLQPVVVRLKPPLYKQIGIQWDCLRNRRNLELFHFLYNAPPLFTPFPFVLTLHDLSYRAIPSMVSWVSRTTAWWQLKWKANRAERIITISEHSKTDIVKRLGIGEENITVIYHGVDSSFSEISGPQDGGIAFKYGLKKPFLLYVGTYLPHKNLETLIHGFRELRLRWKGPLELVLAGRLGRNADRVKNVIAKSGLMEGIRMLGFVEDNDLPALYRLADVFVFPSLYEGFGMPILEAMACGCPVIAARTPSLPEVGGDAAVYFNATSPKDMAEAILQVLQSMDKRSEMVRRGRLHAAGFTWRRAGIETLAVYESVRRSH